MHGMAAAALNAPELMLDEKEAKQIATATAEVARHYNVSVDPKTLAWMQFGWAVSCVYGPRVVAIVMRKKSEKEAAKSAPTPPDEPEVPNADTTGFPNAAGLPTS